MPDFLLSFGTNYGMLTGLFDKFCNSLTFFNIEKQNFLLELTKDFLKISIVDYPRHIKDFFESIPDKYLQEKINIYLLPTILPNDCKRSNSSTSLAYLFIDSELLQSGRLAAYNFRIIQDLDKIPTILKSKENLIILLDDFIGSGDTLVSFIDYLKLYFNIDSKAFLVYSIVIQEEGFNKLCDSGYNVFYSILRKKGISDISEKEKRSYFHKLMQEIETSMNIPPDYIFGYNQTEALVKMNRIPNNTFPVFWHSNSMINSKKYFPPFKR